MHIVMQRYIICRNYVCITLSFSAECFICRKQSMQCGLKAIICVFKNNSYNTNQKMFTQRQYLVYKCYVSVSLNSIETHTFATP